MKALVLILLSYSYGSIYASGIESAKTCIQKITKERKCKYKKNNEFKYTQGTLSLVKSGIDSMVQLETLIMDSKL